MWNELPFYGNDLDDDKKDDKDAVLELSPQDRAALCSRSYEVGSILGEGSFGKVYSGTWNKAVPLAIKSITVEVGNLKYVITEILAFDKLKHNHVIRVHDLFVTSSEQLLILMELALGGDLKDYIWKREEDEDEKKEREKKEKEERNQKKDGEDKKIIKKYYSKKPLPESTARHFYKQFADAFKCMHQLGIAHLDIKPENILLDGEKQVCKVSDFGLAYVSYDPQTGQPKGRATYRGSIPYAAPEVLAFDILAAQRTYYCPFRADVWSAGVVLYEMLNRAWPFAFLFTDPKTGKSWIDKPYMYDSQIKMKYKFKNEKLSEEARTLIGMHLQSNVKRRPIFRQILRNDPWLKISP